MPGNSSASAGSQDVCAGPEHAEGGLGTTQQDSGQGTCGPRHEHDQGRGCLAGSQAEDGNHRGKSVRLQEHLPHASSAAAHGTSPIDFIEDVQGLSPGYAGHPDGCREGEAASLGGGAEEGTGFAGGGSRDRADPASTGTAANAAQVSPKVHEIENVTKMGNLSLDYAMDDEEIFEEPYGRPKQLPSNLA